MQCPGSCTSTLSQHASATCSPAALTTPHNQVLPLLYKFPMLFVHQMYSTVNPGASSTRSAVGLLSIFMPWKGSWFPVNDHSPWAGDRLHSMAPVSWWSLMRQEGNLFCFNSSHTEGLEPCSAGSWNSAALAVLWASASHM